MSDMDIQEGLGYPTLISRNMELVFSIPKGVSSLAAIL